MEFSWFSVIRGLPRTWPKRLAMIRLGRSTTPETPKQMEARRQARRSAVRVYITYGAGIYLVVASGGLIASSFLAGDSDAFDNAKDIYLTTLPVATGILAYWFADRGATKRQENAPSDRSVGDSANQEESLQQEQGQAPRQTPE